MYAKHQKFISDYAQASADNMANVLRFVVITIQNRLFNCPGDLETVNNAVSGLGDFEAAQGILYGHKAQAIAYIEAHKLDIFEQAKRIDYFEPCEIERAASLLGLFASIPGLGLVKAGFCVQLCFKQNLVGCLDSHNIERFGINPNKLRSSRYKQVKKLSTKRKALLDYIDLCKNLGGACELWDSWCEYLAQREDKTGEKFNGNKPLYESAYHVSALHCVALGVCPETGAYGAF